MWIKKFIFLKGNITMKKTSFFTKAAAILLTAVFSFQLASCTKVSPSESSTQGSAEYKYGKIDIPGKDGSISLTRKASLQRKVLT